jgi:hypothetical protein
VKGKGRGGKVEEGRRTKKGGSRREKNDGK